MESLLIGRHGANLSPKRVSLLSPICDVRVLMYQCHTEEESESEEESEEEEEAAGRGMEDR